MLQGGDELLHVLDLVRDASRLNLIGKTLLSTARCIGGEHFSEKSDFSKLVTKEPPVGIPS